jgi:hypothetical protein
MAASGTTKVSISSMNLRPKWQFYRITQLPLSKASAIFLEAILSYPSPIETFSVVFFFFLANSSMDEVGSAPADNKNKTGSTELLDAQMVSIG